MRRSVSHARGKRRIAIRAVETLPYGETQLKGTGAGRYHRRVANVESQFEQLKRFPKKKHITKAYAQGRYHMHVANVESEFEQLKGFPKKKHSAKAHAQVGIICVWQTSNRN